MKPITTLKALKSKLNEENQELSKTRQVLPDSLGYIFKSKGLSTLQIIIRS